jgi:hypothetical protein
VRKDQQEKRAQKMNVASLKFKEDGQAIQNPANHLRRSEDLRMAIKKARKPETGVKFSLFVVEDLSRDVIETLGSELAIDPRFFRAHVTDYVWNNIRDRWREPSILQVDAKRQTWFQLRLIRSRYFENQNQLTKAKKQVNEFNVMRRLDADKNQIFWDKDPDPTIWERLTDESSQDKGRVDAKVGHMRSRATFWLNPESTIGKNTDSGRGLQADCSQNKVFFYLSQLPKLGILFGEDIPTGTNSRRSVPTMPLQTQCTTFRYRHLCDPRMLGTQLAGLKTTFSGLRRPTTSRSSNAVQINSFLFRSSACCIWHVASG